MPNNKRNENSNKIKTYNITLNVAVFGYDDLELKCKYCLYHCIESEITLKNIGRWKGVI